jgi:hypothetical protein
MENWATAVDTESDSSTESEADSTELHSCSMVSHSMHKPNPKPNHDRGRNESISTDPRRMYRGKWIRPRAVVSSVIVEYEGKEDVHTYVKDRNKLEKAHEYLASKLGVVQIDSACSHNMTADASVFDPKDIRPYKGWVETANGELLEAHGMVLLPVIGLMMLVRGLTGTLISCGQLSTTFKLRTVLDDDVTIETRSGDAILKGYKKGEVYFTNFTTQKASAATISDRQVSRALNRRIVGTKNLSALHVMLGHLSVRQIMLMFHSGKLKGLERQCLYIEDASMPPCNACIQGRKASLPTPKRGPTGSVTGGTMITISADPIGPIYPDSDQGYKYALIVGDIGSKFLFARPMKNKAETLSKLKNVLGEIERMGYHPRAIQTDYDTLFRDQRFIKYCDDKNIQRRYSNPYQHHQNGWIERNIGIVLDLTRTLLIASNCPVRFWPHALQHAIFCLNRSVRLHTGDKTPYEIVYNTMADLSKLRFAFYSKVYYFVTKEDRTGRGKFMKRYEPGRILGVDENTQDGFLIRTNNGSIVTRNQIIAEEEYLPDNKGNGTEMHRDQLVIVGYNSKPHERPLEEPKARNVNDDDDDVPDLMEDSDEEIEDEHIHKRNEAASKRHHEARSRPGDREEWDYLIDKPDDEEDAVDEEAPIRGAIPPSNTVRLRSGRSFKSPSQANATRERAKIDWDKIDPATYTPETIADVKNIPIDWLRQAWTDAMRAEYRDLHANNMFSEPIKHFVSRISDSRFVFKVALKQDGTYKRKARLVVRGFRDVQGIDYFEKSNSPAPWLGVRIFLSICVNKQLMPKALDVKQAYTEGNRETKKYIRLPTELVGKGNEIVELNKPLYGEKNAGLMWERKCDEIAKEAKCKKSEFMPSFYWREEGKHFLVMVFYVDDMLWATNNKIWEQQLLNAFKNNVREFTITEEFANFLGVTITKQIKNYHDRNGEFYFVLDQDQYINSINGDVGELIFKKKPTEIPMHINYDISKAIPKAGEKSYNIQSIIGSLRFATDRTRIDTQAAVGILSQHQESVTEYQVRAVQLVLSHCMNNTMKLMVKKDKHRSLTNFIDMAYLVDNQSTSRGSYLIYYGINSCPLVFKSWKIKEVCTSTMHGEMIPLVKLIQTLIYLKNFFEEIGEPLITPFVVYTDSQALIDTISNDRILNGSRHFLMRINYIKQHVKSGLIILKKIRGDNNVADFLTKPLNGESTEKYMKMLSDGVVWCLAKERMIDSQHLLSHP